MLFQIIHLIFLNSQELCRYVIFLAILNTFIYRIEDFLVKILALSLSQIFLTRSLIAFAISGNSVLICSLLFSARSSKLETKTNNRSSGTYSHIKFGSSCSSEKIESEIGASFPIQIVGSVDFNSSVVTQCYSKSKTTSFLDNFCSSV